MESWSQVRIFHSGDEYYSSMIEDIRRAQRSITIESYIFSIDPLTQTILAELANARSRGCTVKVVVDGFGSYSWIPELDEICSRSGIDFQVFHPLPYSFLRYPRYVSRHSIRQSWMIRRLNRRTHRKVAIFDEKRAYLGSLNFTADHCASIIGDKAWRDTGVWVEGTPVQRLAISFQITYLRTFMKGLLSWLNRWRHVKDPHSSILRLNTTKKMRQKIYKDLLLSIHRAQTRIYITTAYFLPKRSLLRAILRATRRGVDVKILIPGESDVPLVKWAAFHMVRFLLQRQLPIYEYQKSILHAKTMIIDDKVHIGSFNLNHRSMLHDLEVEVILQDSDSLNSMLKQWEVDIENSKLVTENDFRAPSWLARLIYWVAFRLRYML